VQIGDPITEKALIELIETARDEELYNAITDCGAGGFSSAVGEMGEALGADVELVDVPLKYPGLRPWEIWLSEAQERMVLAVPEDNLARLQGLAGRWEVVLCVLGRMTGERRLVVRYEGRIVADLPTSFLHDGLPRRRMEATWQEPPNCGNAGASFAPSAFGPGGHPSADFGEWTGSVEKRFVGENGETTSEEQGAFSKLLLILLAEPNVRSKEAVIRRYDHEVRGGTLVRPLVGPEMDGPSDAALLKPLGTWDSMVAFALSNGINPWYGQRDPYRMAISAIDEAVRNAVAVGADPDRIAILDNFCWGNPTYPDRLGSLVRACQGCYDGALAYGTPFISGKDSLYNEFNGKPIPGTLLISAIGIVPNMEKHLTMEFKQAGSLLYVLGETRAELGGSLLFRHLDLEGGQVPGLPDGALAYYRLLHQAIQQDLLIAAHDLSEGGLALALAEMAIGGRLGAEVNLPDSDLTALEQLCSESNGRLLLEVPPQRAAAVEELFERHPLACLGRVTDEPVLRITSGRYIPEETVGRTSSSPRELPVRAPPPARAGVTLVELEVERAARIWKGETSK
ncbi:MAG: AIR synthase-related protein, partial [Ardenticatenaceae bacterium]